MRDCVDDGDVDDDGVVESVDEPWRRRHSPHRVEMYVAFVVHEEYGY